MKSKFLELLNEYKLLLEQPEAAEVPAPDAPEATQGAEDPTQQAASPASPTPQPIEQASVGYAVLVQLLLDAFKTMNIRNPNDIKFSDNVARTPQEAYKYLEIIKRNLEPDLQQKTQEDVGKNQQGNAKMDSADVVNVANLAIKALFFTPKDMESTEYSEIASTQKVTVDNAFQVYEAIRNFLSER